MDDEYWLNQPGTSRSRGLLNTERTQNFQRGQNFQRRQNVRSLSLNPRTNLSRGPMPGGQHFQQTNPNSALCIDNLLTTQNRAPVQQRNTNNSHAKQSTGLSSHRNYESRRESHDKNMGFLTLERLVKTDVKDIIASLNLKKAAFSNLLQSPIERLDIFSLILELIAKICDSSFDQLKLTFLLDVCSSQFINNLRNYLMDLPYQERKSANNKYWRNEIEFWNNFITFCESIMLLSPSTALNKCRSLIEGTSKCCLDMLRERHNFVLPEEYNLKLNQLRETLTAHEQKKLKKEEKKLNNELDVEQEPPENFRELSVLPRREDLLEERPYLRANIIKGRYRDVEHYLDVQFRLLREDCFGPLREGILQFIRDPARRKYDNIRVFHNVKFVQSYITPQRVGSIVEVDENTKRRFKKINWAHSKRFIFGSLVLFTKDNCNSFIVATILDRDVKYLDKGKIPVSIVDITVEDDLYKNDTYTMIESDVYFEPYYHILNVLKDPNFPNQIAMKKYIIDVDPEPSPPAYLTNESIFEIQEPRHLFQRAFTVLDFNTWPSSDDLQLNESQYEAYKTALTHEFAVIQGPPGTGKTYLGVRVAKTLLENLDESGCRLLLVCYTNHALDQFLEAIIPVTESIARIGGQSRNEAMNRFNLNNLRKQNKTHPTIYRLYADQRENLRSSIFKLQGAQADLDSISSSIISYNCLKKYAPDCRAIENCYKKILESGKDPLCYWLFENMEYNFEEPIIFNEEENLEHPNSVSNNDDNRHEVILDDLEIDISVPYGDNIDRAFCLKRANDKLFYMTRRYIACDNGKKKRELHVEIVVLRDRMRLLTQMKEIYQEGFHVIQNNMTEDLSLMPMIDRWMLYFSWTKFVKNEIKKAILPLQEATRKANEAYEETRMMMDYKLLKNFKVVGMTTSGAARLRKLVHELAPTIVIVEEAAEVLEQHIITSLTKSCQHLILIGDHQQLRPSAASMRLAKHFDLEVSLFERMILNAVHSRRLAVQHRMRPSIAALIAPHIYSDLQNHPSVERFPDVRGVTSNVFFFSHDWKEEIIDDSLSRTNKKEGDMTLRMANYIMQQDYKPEDVTILAAYSGQMFYMRNERSRYAHLSNVKITVVDNYQGEESKIILLSLVRNNEENKIGFLGTENRICVALSRAKEGFYIFGNIDILKKNSPLWTKIGETLDNQGAVGTSIKLRCENHANQTTTISSVDDFMKVPEGGCLLKCNYNLPCLHACPLICHSYDRGHDNTVCPFKCERIICELNHVCPLMCKEMCMPCRQMIKKDLPCGHSMKVFCHLEPDSPKIMCLTVVPVKLPKCEHEVKKSCYMDINKVACPVPCEFRVESCGHVCTRRCHVNDDPDHEKYLCAKPCVKAKKGCSLELEGDRGDHQCRKKCHEECDDCNVEVMKKRTMCKHKVRVACSQNADLMPCRKNCARVLACGHFCKKKCYEPCGDCKTKVKKPIPECGHEVQIECRINVSRALCERRCERRLPCQHACRLRCRDDCDPAKCVEIIPRFFDSPCGHKVQLPCNVFTSEHGSPSAASLVAACRAACGAELACGHACAGDCARCERGRLHRPCTQRCSALNICGHECEEACSQLCPPCNKKCEVKCKHGRCPRPCGAPCVPCKEACSRSCPHGSCTRRCGEECTRDACSERCTRRLACGHACRGLCGERCPNICKICRPEDFPTDFLGDEFDDDAVFVVLEDCGHVMEFENLEHLMNSKSETVSLRACPFCRRPVINTHRYKDLVNNRFKTDINPIKERVYGNDQIIRETKKKLDEEMSTFLITHSEISKDKLYVDWKKAFNKLSHFVTTKKKPSLQQLNMHFIYLNILAMLSETYKDFRTAKLKELEIDLVNQNTLICRVLFNNVHKLSQQQQMDIRNELKRMNAIIILSKILSHTSYISNKTDSTIKKAMEAAKEAVLGLGIFKENKAIEELKAFQNAIKVVGVVTKQERELIIRAIGAKAGQWYKCPNGHFYSIDRCGGAMEESRCIECKAPIGGTNHRLLSTNQHAPEIDNSRFPAWSEEANNMANFEFDNLL